ncbi:MAG: heat-inducible transcriptional repressor HrcA [Actinomycetaceae bacterium]|nr:heat-inducible transcriptional repressor HrcA [Actinomycetaceae bacterium]
MTTDRRINVLRAVVSDFVREGEPVGSKALVERHDLGVSPATIRNDMAVLEEEGYLYQPHTSAGRVPTQKGYREFVDQIATLKPLSVHERRAIETFLEGACDIDDVVERTVRLLSQLTRQLAVVQYPVTRKTRLRHVELIPVADHQLMVIVITDAGDVMQHVIESEQPLDNLDVTGLRIILNADAVGLKPEEIDRLLQRLGQHITPEQHQLATKIIHVINSSLESETEERLVVAGAANLVRSRTDFQGSVLPLLDALEEHMTLIRLFSQQTQDETDVSVSIGAENEHNAFSETAVVSDTYRSREDTRAHLGIVGPLRMDYPATMAAVRAVASYLSGFLRQ